MAVLGKDVAIAAANVEAEAAVRDWVHRDRLLLSATMESSWCMSSLAVDFRIAKGDFERGSWNAVALLTRNSMSAILFLAVMVMLKKCEK